MVERDLIPSNNNTSETPASNIQRDTILQYNRHFFSVLSQHPEIRPLMRSRFEAGILYGDHPLEWNRVAIDLHLVGELDEYAISYYAFGKNIKTLSVTRTSISNIELGDEGYFDEMFISNVTEDESEISMIYIKNGEEPDTNKDDTIALNYGKNLLKEISKMKVKKR